jgi:cell division protein FtsQ
MDGEVFPQDLLANEEPKYLRRQKPLPIKRRKFGRKSLNSFLRVTLWAGAGLVCVWSAYSGARFLLAAPEMKLTHPEQVGIAGNHFVSRAAVLQSFVADRGKSILRVPLAERRAQIESLPWVEHATVRRVLPNRIQVDIVERTPVAFLREGSDMLLIDSHGVILDRPLRADFRFPVVTGILPGMPADEREKRMQLFARFSQQVEDARPGAMSQVSEVDLSDEGDLTASVTGLQKPGATSRGLKQADMPVTVHFGNGDFGGKFTTLVDNIAQWRATAGEVDSVDLRFSREAVVNPEIAAATQFPAQPLAKPEPVSRRSARHAKATPLHTRQLRKTRRHSH